LPAAGAGAAPPHPQAGAALQPQLLQLLQLLQQDFLQHLWQLNRSSSEQCFLQQQLFWQQLLQPVLQPQACSQPQDGAALQPQVAAALQPQSVAAAQPQAGSQPHEGAALHVLQVLQLLQHDLQWWQANKPFKPQNRSQCLWQHESQQLLQVLQPLLQPQACSQPHDGAALQPQPALALHPQSATALQPQPVLQPQLFAAQQVFSQH